MASLEARDLARTILFRGEERDLLKPTRLDVRSGEVVGVTGPSGSGKTVLLRLLLGLDPRSLGVIRVGGEEVTPAGLAGFRREVIMVPAGPPPFGGSPRSLFVDAAAFRVRSGAGAPGDLDAEAGTLGIEATDLAIEWERLDPSVARRSWLAVAGALRPRYLVLDEPARGLEPAARATVATWIGHQVTLGTGILVASTDEILLARTASRIMILYDGEVHAEGPPAAVIPAAVAEARRAGR